MSSRPVYIPGKKRQRNQKQQQQQQPRFHGAFTGGFSAGYFNTVGSKEGWTPSNHKTGAAVDQSLEDFMDEQDHQDWGGPNRVRTEYGGGTTKSQSAAAAPIWKDLLQVTHPTTVGPRLLRHLGWREGGSAAYVPSESTTTNFSHSENNHKNSTTTNNCDTEQALLLSKRKLRKIQLLQTRIPLPPPKLDQCGLGFAPYQDAPEFQRHREKRTQLAQARAARAPSSKNVYRASQVLPQNQNQNQLPQNHNNPEEKEEEHHVYESYETMEDFVGTKSVGGFALNDADDDAYDEQYAKTAQAAMAHHQDEYNLEVYEPSSSSDSDEGDDHGDGPTSNKTTKKNHRNSSSGGNNSSSSSSNVLGGLLSSWANANENETSKDGTTSRNVKGQLTTSDGQPPLPGFSLGGSSFEINAQRFPGPDVPLSYQVQPHVFSDQEHPLVFQTLSRAVQLEAEASRKEAAVQEALQSNRQTTRKAATTSSSASSTTTTTTTPMAGDRFAALQQAMKSRFTSASAGTSSSQDGGASSSNNNAVSVGLYVPNRTENGDDIHKSNHLNHHHHPPDAAAASTTKNVTKESSDELKVTRTMSMFSPHPLVCKRFHVSVPQHAQSHSATNKGGPSTQSKNVAQTNESRFFESQILPSLQTQPTGGREDLAVDAFAPTALEHAQKQQRAPAGMVADDAHAETPVESLQRPPMETMKDIFDHSDDEDDDDDDDSEDHGEGIMSAEGREPASSSMSTDLVKFVSTKKEEEEKDVPKPHLDQSQLAVSKENDGKKRDDRDRDRRKRSRKDKHRKRKKHSRSKDDDDVDASSSASNVSRERRKRRKKHSSRSEKDKSRSINDRDDGSSLSSQDSRDDDHRRRKERRKDRRHRHHRDRKKEKRKKSKRS